MVNEGFLGRWARLKRDAEPGEERSDKAGGNSSGNSGEGSPSAREAAPAVAAADPARFGEPPANGVVTVGTAATTESGLTPLPPESADAKLTAPSSLPPIEGLTKDSDFSMFMRSDVDPGVRVSALKKLFADPHFNQMDGLDVYIDDYSKPDPMSLAFLKQLNQSRSLGLFDDEASSDDAAPVADGSTAAAASEAPAQTLAASDSLPESAPLSEAATQAGAGAGEHVPEAVPDSTSEHPPQAGGQALAAKAVDPLPEGQSTLPSIPETPEQSA